MALGNSRYGIDWMARAFEIDSSNQDLVVSEAGVGSDTLTIAAATVWNHADASETSGDHNGLIYALEALLNASGTLTNTYTVAAATPSGSDLTNSGIEITASAAGGAAEFTLEFSDGSTTVNPRWFGWGESPGDQTSSSGVLASPYSLYATWQSPHAAHDKRDARRQSMNSSTSDPVNAYRNPFKGHRRRLMHYRFVPAGHVRRWAAEDSDIASDAGLPTGDINNAFADFLWEASASNEDILVVYDDGDDDLQVDSHTDKYEYVRFADDREIESLLQMIEDVPRGEEYDLMWHFASDLDDPEYKDP